MGLGYPFETRTLAGRSFISHLDAFLAIGKGKSMNERLGPDHNELEQNIAQDVEPGKAEIEETNESLTIDDVYFAELLGQEGHDRLELYTPQAEIAALKQRVYQSQLEKTPLTLANPLYITHRELVKEWLPSSKAGWPGMEAKIREATEAGHDGIAVEPDPAVARLVENGTWPTNNIYTFATESYYKFSPTEESE